MGTTMTNIFPNVFPSTLVNIDLERPKCRGQFVLMHEYKMSSIPIKHFSMLEIGFYFAIHD